MDSNKRAYELVGRRARPTIDPAPEGAYTTLRTYREGTHVLRLAGHLERLVDSAKRLGVAASLERADVAAALQDALLQQGATPGESRIRLTYAPPRLLAELTPFSPPSEAMRRDGVACATVGLRRRDPACKDTRFSAAAQQAVSRLPAGVHEGLMLDEQGAILEGLSSNFFALHEGRLRTEGERMLPGLTRALVLELARKRVAVEPRPVTRVDLPHVAECFLTSTSRGVLPVVRVDGTVIADGRPGGLTLALMRDLDARIAAETQPLATLAQAAGPPGS